MVHNIIDYGRHGTVKYLAWTGGTGPGSDRVWGLTLNRASPRLAL